jgi:transcriptional regulator with XRE-family HTH domain
VSRVEETSSVLREVHRRLLRRLRQETADGRLTQRELAERSGLSRHHLFAIESGRSSLTEGALARYLAALDVEASAYYEMAARVAAEVERRGGVSTAADAPAGGQGADARPLPGLPRHAEVLWQRETSGEVLVLMQLPPRGAVEPVTRRRSARVPERSDRGTP